MPIRNFYAVNNQTTKEDKTDDFKEYCELRDSEKAFYLEKNCKRMWMNLKGKGRGSAGINILWPEVKNKHYKDSLQKAKKGESPNNISPIIQYSLKNSVKILWMGDLEADFMENIENDVSFEKVDILFAPHHGRESGKVPESWLDKLKPEIIVIGEAPSKNLNYYQDFNTIKQNSAGDILFDCITNKVHIYTGSLSYKEGFLANEQLEGNYGLYYLGTFTV